MPQDTQVAVSQKELTPLRKYVVGYMILGEYIVEATSAEAAKDYVDRHKSIHEHAENGHLEVFEAEPAEATQ